MVEGFVKWMLQEEVGVSSVSRMPSTVKGYCKLAAKAEQIDPTTNGMFNLTHRNALFLWLSIATERQG
jgi:hypothetical protein